MYHNKLTYAGFTSVFITLAVVLLFQAQGIQGVTPVKAARHAIPASDLNVVSQPVLTAATVDTIFKSLGSPMSGTGQVVEQASHQTNIDDAFALAVWWTETNDGAAGVGLADRNPGSVRGSVGYPSAFDGYTIYPSYSAAIVYWFNMLKNMYVNRGLSTVYAISHPYVGTSGSPVWAGKVVALMLKYRGEAPPAPVVVPHGKRVTEPTVYISASEMPLVPRFRSQPGKTLTAPLSKVAKQGNTLPAAPSSYEYVIVYFAILLALAIAVGALLVDKIRPIRDTQRDEAVIGGVPAHPAVPGVATPPFDAAIPRNIGALFPNHRTILLPSLPLSEAASPGELPAGSSQNGRSTGLLRLYGETHQQ